MDKANKLSPKDITDDVQNEANKDVTDKVNVEEGAAEKVESEKLKCSNKIPIDFHCTLKQLCKGTQPKTVGKLQEHLRLCHKQKKGAFV